MAISDRTAQRAERQLEWSPLLVGFAIFGLLWLLHIPLREIYLPDKDDISQFADSLLVAPSAHWQDWFTRGYSHSFDLYPDWQAHNTEYAKTAWMRPAFQFAIYLAHFLLGRDWASYELINWFAVAGMVAVAFQIAQQVLGLRTGPSLVAAMLVALSPPLWVSEVSGVGFAIEPLATVLVAGAFLAVLARRDLLCLALLFVAILTKENTLWAPLTAATTIMLRPKPGESVRRRGFAAAAMLFPLAVWLGLRFAFFGGIGGTYATARYTPLAHFLELTLFKLTHMHYLLALKPPMGDPQGAAFLILDRTTALLTYVLLSLWALRALPEAVNHVRNITHEIIRWPTLDAVSIVNLWSAAALAFHFALPLGQDRYATSVVVFLWPALMAEVERRGKGIIWLCVAVLCAGSLTRSYRLFQWIDRPIPLPNSVSSVNRLLTQVPTGTRQIYVLSAGGLQEANPESVGLILGVSAEIIRVAEIASECRGASDLVGFDHTTADGVVSLNVTLPACANFYFATDRFNSGLTNGRLYRNGAMNYELPEADPQKESPYLFLGRRITVHVRPKGPARFIIEHGGPNGIAWFDTP